MSRAGPPRLWGAWGGLLLSALVLLSVSCTSTTRQSGESTEVSAGGRVSTETNASQSGLAPDESRVLGLLPSPEDQTVEAIAAPASVKAGERFTVTVTTQGSGCDRAGDTGVILGDGEATLMVYDYTRANRPDVVCAMILKYLKHELPLTFDRPGEAVIRVWGRRTGPDAPPPGKPVVIERKIRVR